jgi:hypothetical protein
MNVLKFVGCLVVLFLSTLAGSTPAIAGGAAGNNAGTTIRCGGRPVMLDYYLAEQDGLNPIERDREELAKVVSSRLQLLDFEIYLQVLATLPPLKEWSRGETAAANDAMLEHGTPAGCRLGQVSSFIPGRLVPPVLDPTVARELSPGQLAIAELHEAVYMIFSGYPYFHTNPVLSQKLVGLLIARDAHFLEIKKVIQLARRFPTARADEPQGEYALDGRHPRRSACPESLTLVRTGGYGVQVLEVDANRESRECRVTFRELGTGLGAELPTGRIRIDSYRTLEVRDDRSSMLCTYRKVGVGVSLDDLTSRSAYSRNVKNRSK